MDLSLYSPETSTGYKSASQISRVLTEHWFLREMYCPNCLASPLDKEKNNTKVVDFLCSRCRHEFQLKSQGKKLSSKVVDGAYRPMMEMISKNLAPDFFFMEYEPEELLVKNLLLVPRFFMIASVIEKRKPLSQIARRAGWTGCNILLAKLPENGKISVVKNEKEVDPQKVRMGYERLKFLDTKKSMQRGWLSDVLYYVQKVKKNRFMLKDVYRFEKELQEMHPENKHIRDKIRQQLQLLRDQKLLVFEGNGRYRVR